MEPREEDIFKNQTTKLWRLAKEMTPYKCSDNCKAPSRFYIGEPWIDMGEETIEDGQEKLEIYCKIWNGDMVVAKNYSDEIRWTFNGELLFAWNHTEDRTKVSDILFFLIWQNSASPSSRGRLLYNSPCRSSSVGCHVLSPLILPP